MIRAIVVQRTGVNPQVFNGFFKERGRYLVYRGKSGNLVITTDYGMAFPVETRATRKKLREGNVAFFLSLDDMAPYFSPESDLHESQARDGKGFRIKYFDSYKDLYKHAGINTKSGVPKQVNPLGKLYADVNKKFGLLKSSVKTVDPLELVSYNNSNTVADFKVVDQLVTHLSSLGNYVKTLAQKYPEISLVDITDVTLTAFSNYMLDLGVYDVNPYSTQISMHSAPSVMYPTDGSKEVEKATDWTPSPADLPFPFGFPPLDAGQKDTHDITKIIRSLGKQTKF